MQITFQIAVASTQRVVDALCEMQGYEAHKLPGESRGDFAKRVTKDWWMSQVKTYEGSKAADAIGAQADQARRDAWQRVEDEIEIT